MRALAAHLRTTGDYVLLTDATKSFRILDLSGDFNLVYSTHPVLVPKEGFEPSCPKGRQILNLLRMPVPPLRQMNLEPPIGFEPIPPQYESGFLPIKLQRPNYELFPWAYLSRLQWRPLPLFLEVNVGNCILQFPHTRRRLLTLLSLALPLI